MVCCQFRCYAIISRSVQINGMSKYSKYLPFQSHAQTHTKTHTRTDKTRNKTRGSISGQLAWQNQWLWKISGFLWETGEYVYHGPPPPRQARNQMLNWLTPHITHLTHSLSSTNRYQWNTTAFIAFGACHVYMTMPPLFGLSSKLTGTANSRA